MLEGFGDFHGNAKEKEVLKEIDWGCYSIPIKKKVDGYLLLTLRKA